MVRQQRCGADGSTRPGDPQRAGRRPVKGLEMQRHEVGTRDAGGHDDFSITDRAPGRPVPVMHVEAIKQITMANAFSAEIAALSTQKLSKKNRVNLPVPLGKEVVIGVWQGIHIPCTPRCQKIADCFSITCQGKEKRATHAF